MSRRLVMALIACACLAWAAGCKDGLGRALVDHRGPPGTDRDGGCESRPPACENTFAGGPDDAGIQAIEAAPVALKTCGAYVPGVCGDDALGAPPAGPDAGVVSVECGMALPLRGDGAAHESSELDCAALRLTDDGPPTAAFRTRIPNVSWRHSNVAITSSRPITLELDKATLNDVWIDLSGPVTLRIAQDSRLSQVRMHVREAAAGVPRVELVDSQAERLAVTTDDEPFSGTIALARMHLQRTQLRARALIFESVAGGEVQFEAADLSTADCVFNEAVFAFDHAVMAATMARMVNIPRCGTFTLANGTFEFADFAPCTGGPLRAYGVTITNSTIAGEVDGDHASFERVLFGATGELSVIGWDSTFYAVNFCGGTRALRFGNLPKITCSACEDHGREVDLHVCNAPATEVTAALNYCSQLQWEAPEQPPQCPAPAPLRERPH